MTRKGKLVKISTNINPVIDTLLHAYKNHIWFNDDPEKGKKFLCVIGKDQHLDSEVMGTTTVQDVERHMTDKSLNFWTKNTEYQLTWE